MQHIMGMLGRFINHRCAPTVTNLVSVTLFFPNKMIAEVSFHLISLPSGCNTPSQRCYDANLVEIPIGVEIPDHHYHHVSYS